MYKQILQEISRFISLNESERQNFIHRLKIRKLKKKEVLLREGQVCHSVYFINNGCLRYFYNVEGEENTGQFFFENGWYTDYGSFLTGETSLQNIDALEKTEVLYFSRTDLLELYVECPQFERFGRIMAERAFLGIRTRNEMLVNQTAEERYLDLLNRRPKIFQRVPQHYIASYLGIKAPSLSRIRKRISG